VENFLPTPTKTFHFLHFPSDSRIRRVPAAVVKSRGKSFPFAFFRRVSFSSPLNKSGGESFSINQDRKFKIIVKNLFSYFVDFRVCRSDSRESFLEKFKLRRKLEEERKKVFHLTSNEKFVKTHQDFLSESSNLELLLIFPHKLN
jgi:hypothetical protein